MNLYSPEGPVVKTWFPGFRKTTTPESGVPSFLSSKRPLILTDWPFTTVVIISITIKRNILALLNIT